MTEAYETLRDPEQRQEYDTHGEPTTVSPPSSVEFQGFDFSATGSGTAASATFGELFSNVFQDAGERAGATADQAERGSDLYGEITLSFEEALQGAERRLTVTRLDTCEGCGGTGRRRAVEGRCNKCHGVGTTRWRAGTWCSRSPASTAAGRGVSSIGPCTGCHAGGTVTRDEDITIQVPSGVNNGARLRVEAKGNRGRLGGEPGDLYITANVTEHRFLRREGDDLHLELPIAIHEAALGAKIDVPTLDGAARLRVPPGTQSGQRFGCALAACRHHIAARGAIS